MQISWCAVQGRECESIFRYETVEFLFLDLVHLYIQCGFKFVLAIELLLLLLLLLLLYLFSLPFVPTMLRYTVRFSR